MTRNVMGGFEQAGCNVPVINERVPSPIEPGTRFLSCIVRLMRWKNQQTLGLVFAAGEGLRQLWNQAVDEEG